MDIHPCTITELRRHFHDGDLSPSDAVESLVTRIDAIDPKVRAYLSCDAETALREAEQADVSLPLGGVPVAIKDVINVLDQPCSCGSKILHGKYTSPYDATVIRKLRAAGAIPFGRLNMDEFAMGSSTENSGIQTTKNPWDLDRIPGGSSGGSAAAVAADEAFAALGSDTGGSIRQPASHCGCVGLKPSYGRVSRYGLVAFASSLDQIGPVTKTVEDAAILLNAIAGPDEKDSTCVNTEAPDYTAALGRDIAGMKIGLPKEYFVHGIDPAVESAVRDGVQTLEQLGAEIVEVSLPHTEPAVAVYYVIATAEASANLARFDGVRYGHRSSEPPDIITHYKRTREEGFGSEVKRRIILGTYVLSSGYYDAYYLRAQKVRTLIRQDFIDAFEEVDALVAPVSPTPAFRIGEMIDDPLQMYLGDIFTIAANLAGICALSVPCGFAPATATGSGSGRENGAAPELPVGMQLLGKPFGEESLLRIAHAYEQATPALRTRRPPLT